MENVNPVIRSILGDLFINLAAGWIGVLIIVPNFSNERGWKKKIILTADIVLAIICLLLAFLLRNSL
jgi:hypothetical protein